MLECNIFKAFIHEVQLKVFLQHIVRPCKTLQHPSRFYTTLHHVVTHCNTLQHAATRCITLQLTCVKRCRICKRLCQSTMRAYALTKKAVRGAESRNRLSRIHAYLYSTNISKKRRYAAPNRKKRFSRIHVYTSCVTQILHVCMDRHS